MKVNEIFLSEEQLYEISLKHAVAAGALGASLMIGQVRNVNDKPVHATPVVQGPTEVVYPSRQQRKTVKEEDQLANFIAKKYKVDPKFALQVIQLAHKYAKSTFPKAKDILAIAEIESSFDPNAVSGLRHDPAVGLLQIRPKIWGLDPGALQGENTIENQIATGADILHAYYRKLHDKYAAVAAYNVGLGDFRSGNNAEGYVSKYTHAVRQYHGI